jgi:hypothetical protein
MISCNRLKVEKTSLTKNAFEIMMKNESKLENDSRPYLFSSNCPIRCGTSGYSYKRLVHISNSVYSSFHI